MSSADAAVAIIAARQKGLVTRAQALRAGVSSTGIDRRLAGGRWFRLERSVYLVAGAPVTWRVKVLAACLATDGVASHRTAAVLNEVHDFREGAIDVTIPHQRKSASVGARVHRSGDVHLFRPRRIDGIPVTPVSRLAVDLGAVVAFPRFERAVDELVGRRLLTWPQAVEALLRHARPGRPGVGALRQLVSSRLGDDVDESTLERAWYRLYRSSTLPRPVRQLKIYDDVGFVARVDIAYPQAKIAIELDSKQFHLTVEAFEADRRKRNRLELAGWMVLAFTWEAVMRNPALVLAQIEQALASRGGP